LHQRSVGSQENPGLSIVLDHQGGKKGEEEEKKKRSERRKEVKKKKEERLSGLPPFGGQRDQTYASCGKQVDHAGKITA